MPAFKKSSNFDKKVVEAEIIQDIEEHDKSEDNSSSSSAHTLVEDKKAKVLDKVTTKITFIWESSDVYKQSPTFILLTKNFF